MFAMSMFLTLWFAPGWVTEFLQALRDYRGYAGTTGAEAMWGSGTLCLILVVFFAAVGGAMCVVSYKAREQRLHLIVFSYILALQGVIFPAHSYVTILGFPAVVLALHRGWLTLRIGRRLPAFANGAGVCVAAYMVYRFWLVMFTEAGLPDKFTQILLQTLHYFPPVTFPPFLILGMILFTDWAVDHFRSRNVFSRK
jgi:hypothetical protein